MACSNRSHSRPHTGACKTLAYGFDLVAPEAEGGCASASQNERASKSRKSEACARGSHRQSGVNPEALRPLDVPCPKPGGKHGRVAGQLTELIAHAQQVYTPGAPRGTGRQASEGRGAMAALRPGNRMLSAKKLSTGETERTGQRCRHRAPRYLTF
eukprot:CAMPEP_0171227770 /NCGR_PEP_ID=MMETSP0790-20130122/38017_1 /TAXON_ID=2925 /ORGANISM="Alexandrium catenella, Strain OF101" /LENGTH=155 /DNA_ID=CAMNT_0011693891 /DNA_START=38 /DNA_END=504 /DNA_ORIENTATION=+